MSPDPTLFSPELLDDTEDPLSDRQAFSSAVMCRPTKAHAFTVSTGMPKEASKVEKSEWRLEPEGETEVQEIVVVSDAVESTFVDLEAKAIASRRKQKTLSVILVPVLQQLLSGGLHMVDLQVKAYKLVVLNLLRKVRLEATKQAVGRANWRKF